MIKRQTDDGQSLTPLSQEDKKRRRRWLVLLLLLLLLVPICLWLVSQLALVALGMDEAHESLLSRLQATYVPWDQAQFGPLDPALIGTIRAEQATFAANAARPGGVLIIPFVPGNPSDLTQIAANESATPTTRMMPTSTATRGATSTPIIVFYPATSTDTSGSNPTPDWTTPAATSAPPSTTVPPPPGPSATPNPTLIPPTPRANLSITKTDGVGTYTPGGSRTYTIVVRNNGPANVANATVTDMFPAQITSANWTCSATAGSSCPPGGSGNINVSVNLRNGGTATFTVNVTISPSATGNLVNTASVTAPAGVIDPAPGNNSATDTDLLGVDLAITKGNGLINVLRGNPITYTIVVSNPGTIDVTGATVSDPLPADLGGPFTWTCTPAGGASSTCPPAGSAILNATANLPAASSVTYTVDTVLSVTAPVPGNLINTATVSTPGDINPANNTATDMDPIEDVTVTLNWDSEIEVDLDLWMVDPSNPIHTILSYSHSNLLYPHPSSAGGTIMPASNLGDITCGELSFNSTTGRFEGQERIQWPASSTPAGYSPYGTYYVYVYHFIDCTGAVPGRTVSWSLTLTIGTSSTVVASGALNGLINTVSPLECPGLLLLPGTGTFTPNCPAVGVPPYDPSTQNPNYSYSFSLP